MGGQPVLGHVFTALLVDGQFGLFTHDGTGSFGSVPIETTDVDVHGFASPPPVGSGGAPPPDHDFDGHGERVEFALGGGTSEDAESSGAIAPVDEPSKSLWLTVAELDWVRWGVRDQARNEADHRALVPALGVGLDWLVEIGMWSRGGHAPFRGLE